ncbi:MAG: LamG domain-containing protein [Candidatus Bathyarchaeia archaeon]
MKRAVRSVLKRGSIRVAVLLVFVVLLSASSGVYAGASFFAQQAPNVTVTTTILTTTTSWTTSTVWSTVTAVVYGVWTTVQYTTSTSTVTVTGSTSYSNAKIVTANGNARITTAQSEFGGASGLFNGNGAYLSTPDSADWYFGTGSFTIDFWIRFNALPTAGQYVLPWGQWSASPDQNTYFGVHNVAGTYYWIYQVWDVTSQTIKVDEASPGLSTNTWYHVALVRNGNSWYIFQNGAQCGTTVTNAKTVPDIAGGITIGEYGGAYFLNGWLDEFRISKGIGRWTNNFTPPTSAYTRDSNTVLLLHMDGIDASTAFIDDVTTG